MLLSLAPGFATIESGAHGRDFKIHFAANATNREYFLIEFNAVFKSLVPLVTLNQLNANTIVSTCFQDSKQTVLRSCFILTDSAMTKSAFTGHLAAWIGDIISFTKTQSRTK